jgi:pyruvate-ferredoxin/flavodoxin oxidoreductase
MASELASTTGSDVRVLAARALSCADEKERSPASQATLDGNSAAADVAYRASEVIAIYPITPSSAMGELADGWSSSGRANAFGSVPQVIEMQSEGGAAGALHGALQAGSLATTFTSSQGLLLMIPNMFKIAGELLPTVFHVAARTIATHALSIFGDHSDVMAARSTGWILLCSSSVQEAQDFALVAHASALRARLPVLHFFDGFRTSHEINKITELAEDDLRAMLDADLVAAHRARALSPDHPVLRGSAQNPDVFFQAREAANPYYDAAPSIVQREMDRLAALTGRAYRLFEYRGASDAERVVVMMGSGVGAGEEALEHLLARGEKVGLLKVRLYRPFDGAAFVASLPRSVRRIAVLDRTKEPGAVGEPLYQDVIAALIENWNEPAATSSTTNERTSSNPAASGPRSADALAPIPRVIGGRYGLSSKEFTPAMALSVFAELERADAKRHFTIGIVDDVTHTSLAWERELDLEPSDVVRAVFYGLGSDGTVGATKNSVKIIGEGTPFHAQGYFVYDSKKAGAVTVSHLRFSPRPIRSSYLIARASFVSCSQFHFLERMDVLESAAHGATFLLNSPYAADAVWDRLPREVQDALIAKSLRFFVIDAHQIARDAGLAGRTNIAMQAGFFALAGILPRDEALERIRGAIAESYKKGGESAVRKNCAVAERAFDALSEVRVPSESSSRLRRIPPVTNDAPDFVKRVTAMMIAGKGDLLPVSALPVDGTFPLGTARFEKRSIAEEIPIWDPAICIQCGLCPLVCPHAAIRMKPFPESALAEAPQSFETLAWSERENDGWRMAIQVAPDDCTGCGICVEVCPARSKEVSKHKAINMQPKLEHLERERANFAFYSRLPAIDRRAIEPATVKGSQVLEPLFEFSSACAGCGETPYLKLLSQLFGDRALVANATGCSSIYGGNLPVTPWSTNADGRGPSWANSLFEDNAEFGLGMRLAVDQQTAQARGLLERVAPSIGDELARSILACEQRDEAAIAAQRERVSELKKRLSSRTDVESRALWSVADALVRRSVWIVGGDGWAYDIGFGGLDHVLASGRDVNVLVLDTEVYSNTGGQASKATPRGAIAKFAAGGKPVKAKDLGLIAMAYGDVYVAQIALGANPAQAIRVFHEAESFAGPSLIIAYSHCIAHGIDMRTAMAHQKELVQSGFRPLYHHDPRAAANGAHALKLDSKKPTIPFERVAAKEARFAVLARTDPERAKELFARAQRDIDERWHWYEQLSGIDRAIDAKSAEVPS